MRRRLAVTAIFLLIVAAAVAAESRLRETEMQRDAGSKLLYLPSGKYLRALAPGYPELLADIIYLWSIQYYSEYERGQRYEYLDHVYRNVISELDPRYQDPYLVGALIMAMEAHDGEMALGLLDKGMEANPDNWLLPFEAGFYAYDTLEDHGRAARYFKRAMNIPGSHPIIRRLHAEMYNKMGDPRTSLGYWMEIYRTAEDEYVRDVSYRHVHDLRIRVDTETLREAVRIYTQLHGRRPPGLETLVSAEIINRVPHDPEGSPYLYNRNTGEIRSRATPLLRQRPR
jgi:hypothetical protein